MDANVPSNGRAETGDGVSVIPKTYMENNGEIPDEGDFKKEATLSYTIPKFSKITGPLLSPPTMIRGLSWNIMVAPRENPRGVKSVGFFLQCNGDLNSKSWSCCASAILRVKSKKTGIPDDEREINHVFYHQERDFGYACFLGFDDILDPEKGFCQNDSVTFEIFVSASAPHSVQWDSKKLTGYVGLKNQGATCYMNSLLQALFCTNKLRKAVYQMPTEYDDPESCMALSMQRVFHGLQFSDKPVGTKKLTRSFGWDSEHIFLQHDVHELCRVLLDNLESKMKGTSMDGTIPNIFEGKQRSYIRCKNVTYESKREEPFCDLQLGVKGKKTIVESFRDYVSVELLDGNNKYDAGDFGLQDAEKGVIIIKFPPVLYLQLMRFEFQFGEENGYYLKINDRLEFPERWNLNEFLEAPESTPATYVLHAVFVHAGNLQTGHYVVYINPKCDGQWFKFNDDVVSKSTKFEAIDANFGGAGEESHQQHCTSAYMRVYVRESSLEDILQPVTEDDIPAHLLNKLAEERERAALRKREKNSKKAKK